jgi:hypothetical protein
VLTIYLVMTAKQTGMVNDLIYAEKDLGCPSFTWNSQTYPGIWAAPISQLVLGEGGYESVLTISLTVRIFNADGSFVFANNAIPRINDNITVGGVLYAVGQVNQNIVGACFEIVGNGPYKGV